MAVIKTVKLEGLVTEEVTDTIADSKNETNFSNNQNIRTAQRQILTTVVSNDRFLRQKNEYILPELMVEMLG